MYNITIIDKISGTSVVIPIISKKTVLTGKGSSGKTYLFAELTAADMHRRFDVFYNGGSVQFVNTKVDLEASNKTNLLISDEDVLNHDPAMYKLMLELSNPVLIICRNLNIAGETDARSVLLLDFDGVRISVSPYCNTKFITLPTGTYTNIICESDKDKSEYLILSKLLGLTVEAARGNNNVSNKVWKLFKRNKNIRILVVADTSAFSSPSLFLTGAVPPDKYEVYDYPCFEALLLYSKLVVSLGEVVEKYDFSYKSLEIFFEKELERITKGTKLEYKHRPSKVSECFYSECKECSDYADPYVLKAGSKREKSCDEQDPNTIGKVLFNKYGIGLMAWYYANYTQFLETYNYLIEDKSKIPEEQALDILNSIKDIYLGDLRYKCFDD